MKGKMKKLVAFALATIMVLAMGMTAFAAPGDEGESGEKTETTGTTITIEKALKNADYTAYKIFNVSGSGDAASYTRPKKDGDTVVAQLPDTELFTKVEGATDYYYNVNEDKMSADALATYIKGLKPIETYALAKVDAKASNNEGDNNTAVFTNLPDGYYFITNNTTANIAILRAVSGTPITITEKNQTSDWGTGGGKFAKNAENATEQDKFYAIGDTIYYEVVYKNAYNYSTVITKEGDTEITTTEKVYQYVAEDEMPEGLSLKTDTLKVEVKEAGADTYKELTKVTEGTAKETYRVAEGTTIDENGFSIVIPWAGTQTSVIVNEDNSDAYYGAPTEIRITYQATVTADVTDGVAITNEASIRPNKGIKSDTNTKKVDVYTGSIQVEKFDNSNITSESTEEEIAAAKAKKLGGAEFVIIDTETVTAGATKYLKYTEAEGYDWTIDATDTAIVKLTTKEADGKSDPVKGLDKGTYFLLETKAPSGYNLMDTTTKVEIAEDDATTEAALVKVPSIGNKQGALLPSTGGIGTTIFYVVGGILVAVAGVLLITKKRMGGRD